VKTSWTGGDGSGVEDVGGGRGFGNMGGGTFLHFFEVLAEISGDQVVNF
jgi:hypothetical protein